MEGAGDNARGREVAVKGAAKRGILFSACEEEGGSRSRGREGGEVRSGVSKKARHHLGTGEQAVNLPLRRYNTEWTR